MLIPLWQRIIGVVMYMLPWSDSIPFGRNLFNQIPFLQWLALPTFPIILVERSLPFGSLLIFFLLFLAVVRNPKAPYFVKFHTLQALLIDIGVILLTYAFQILMSPFGPSLIARTFASTVFISILAIIIFTIIECLQGKEADLPGISGAVRIQLS